MASTSASSSMPAFIRYDPPKAKLAFQSDKRYHVFLSFRGPDVRKTLVDHLFQALSTAGLNVFIDSEKLEKGEMIGESLERAIKSSAIRIPIFSKGYADSAWCLKEAAAMLNTPALIIPLFYYVDPTHVRYPLNESSPYKQAFEKHYDHPDRYQREEVDGWKDALDKICSRSGWSMDITEGFEARLVKIVVNDLIKTLDRVLLQVAKHPVGLDKVSNLLIHQLNLTLVDEVVKVGIWGIGGIGKTTVAKALYNQVHANFESASFVANVRTIAADAIGLTNLQRQILKDLTKNDVTVNNVDQGVSLFRDRLGGKRVLLILDDVDVLLQLNALVGDWLAPGSRVIITSRDKQILIAGTMSSQCIYEMSGLQINEGLELFSWHAFLRASPSPNYENISRKIVEVCKGHPLSLEVIGSFLYGKQDDTGCWTEALKNIALNPEIHKRLYISYSALTDDEKEIFVDIACFFIGQHRSLPIVFWKSLYTKVETAVSNLSMKLLIKIDDKSAFDMHDHLRDLGRTIAEKEKQGTRLWKVSHLSTLSNNINLSRIHLNGGNLQRLEMLYKPGLCYLHLRNVCIEGVTENMQAILPPSLKWLRFDDCTFAIGKNTANFAIEKKIRKTYRAPNKKDHFRFVGNINQLKIMQLTNNTIHSMPPLFSFPNVQHLQHLDLRRCVGLNNLPDSIGNLLQLQHLNLYRCQSLNNLPDSIGNLSQLQHLVLGWCRSLNNLPNNIGNLSQLQHLDLQWCTSLNKLPDSIGNLSQLQYLDLEWCTGLNKLPDSIGNLSRLQHLDLRECMNLNNLPDGIGNLSQLQHLDMRECINLNSLPNSIGNLSQLQYLDLEWCTNLTKLSDSIANLSQLQHLDLRGCRSLNKLPHSIGNLSQLQHMDLGGCRKLTKLPNSIGNLSQLKHLNLSGCEWLNDLPDSIGNLSQLQHLDLSKVCRILKEIPDSIGNLSQLQYLSLRECIKLNKLPYSILKLSQLQHLDMSGCRYFSILDNLPATCNVMGF